MEVASEEEQKKAEEESEESMEEEDEEKQVEDESMEEDGKAPPVKTVIQTPIYIAKKTPRSQTMRVLHKTLRLKL